MANLSRWRIFRSLASLQDRIRNLFRRATSRRNFDEQIWDGWFVPATDVKHTAERMVYEIEMPGLDPKDINVRVCGNWLTIRAERKRHRETKKMNILLSESAYGAFATSFELPASVDPDSLTANYHNGVLTLQLQKHAWARPKRIPVRSGEAVHTLAKPA
jgi:HSP20 family protein